MDFPKAFLIAPKVSISVTTEVLTRAFFQQSWEKAPGKNWEKMIDFTAKLGEINDIEHNKGSNNPQNQAILDCILPTIPFKYHCDMVHCFS